MKKALDRPSRISISAGQPRMSMRSPRSTPTLSTRSYPIDCASSGLLKITVKARQSAAGDDIIIDVMPTDERILGFSNRWYMPALASSQPMEIAELGLRVVTAVYFLAMKLEAFHGRGDDDVMGSYDLEDLITVIDGRPQIIDELRVAAPDVRSYVASELYQLLRRRDFIDALPGFILPDVASQGRGPLLRDRMTAIAAL